MRKIELQFSVNAPPELIWNIITNFKEYPCWEPFVQLSGRREVGADLECYVRIRRETRRVPGRATITEYDPSSTFAWAVAVDPLVKVEERYVLFPESGGTRIVHQLQISGWASIPWHFLLNRKMRAMLSMTNHSLVKRMQQVAGKDEGRGRSGNHVRLGNKNGRGRRKKT